MDDNEEYGEPELNDSNNPEWFREAMNNLQNNQNQHSAPPANSGQTTQNSPIMKAPGRRRFVDDDEKFASIDHTARAEKLKQQNYLKFRAKYGDDDMR